MPFGKGLDVIQQAQSGTGKTATFCAGILQNLDYNLMECQALVLAPTRELAQQIEKVMRALGDYQQVEELSSAWTLSARSLHLCIRKQTICIVLSHVVIVLSLVCPVLPLNKVLISGDAPVGQVSRLCGWYLRARGYPHPSGWSARRRGHAWPRLRYAASSRLEG